MEEINFDEMRNQIAILKTKLDKQEIINERLMHSVISNKTNIIRRKMIISICCGLFVIVMSPLVFHHDLCTSWAFVIGTDILMLYCIVRELLFKRQIIDNKALMSANLLYVAENMKNFKAGYKHYFLSNIVLLAIWITWLIIEEIMSNSSEAKYFFIGGLAVGGIIGSAIGLYMYFRIQNSASDIIKQIEE